MRRLVIALVVTTTLAAASARAAEFAWPGRGAVRMTAPPSWTVSAQDAGEKGIGFRAAPSTEGVLAQITLLALPPGEPRRAEDVRKELEKLVQPYLDGSVEKAFAPERLPVSQGSGWVVQLTDASLVGKTHEPGNCTTKRARCRPSRRPARGSTAASQSGAFEFTVPQSRVKVRVSGLGLRPDGPADLEKRYFKLSRGNPQLILSGWLEPASAYEGLKGFWAAESRSPGA